MLTVVLIFLAVLLLAASVWGNLVWRPREMPSAPGGAVTLPSGHRLHVTELPGAEPPVVFIHGLPGSIRDWDHVQPLLADRHRIAIDRPGFGDTGGAPMTMRQQADVIAEGLRALNVDDALLVGHSYGGTLALTIARQHPDLVGGIVLVAPMGGGRKMPLAMRMEARALLLVTVPVIGDLVRMTVGSGILKLVVRHAFTRAFDPSQIDRAWHDTTYAHTLKVDTLRSLYANRVDFNRDFGWLDRHLDEVTVPVGIVRATDDAMVGQWSALGLRDYLPNVVSFQRCDGGHMIPIMRPQTVAEAVGAVTMAMRPDDDEDPAGQPVLGPLATT